MITLVNIHHEVCGFGVSLKPHAQVGDVVGFKESLGAVALRARFSGVHHNLGGISGIKVHDLQFY